MFADQSLIDMLNFRYYLPNTIAPGPVYYDKEIMQEVETRGVKRRQVSPECNLVYGNKMPKIEESDAYFDGDFNSPTSSPRDSVENQCEGTPYFSGYLWAPKEEPFDLMEEIVQEAAAPVKKGPGRPIRSKNGPREVQMVNARLKKRHCGEKTAFTYPQMITLALLNSPEEKATVYMMYEFVLHHFPGIDANSSWKNTLRHALAFENRFQKELPGRSSFWYMVPGRRDQLIRSVKAAVDYYKDDLDALRMRDIAELPSILSGACGIPDEAQNSQDKCAVIEEPCPASDSEFKQNAKQHTYCTMRTANMLDTEQELYSILSTSCPLPEKQQTYPRCQKRLTDGKKPAFKYHHMIVMTLLNSPEEKATVHMMYAFVLHHFPSIGASYSWKNNLRHALAYENGFQKQLSGRSSFWYFEPGRRNELIRSVTEVIVYNKDDMNALGMRDIAELSSILSGTSGIPDRAQHLEYNCAVIEEPCPASDSEFKQNLGHQPSTFYPALEESERLYPRHFTRRNHKKKSSFKYHHMIAMALLNSPDEAANVQMIYAFVLYHFPSIDAIASWKNSIRHALMPCYGFEMFKRPGMTAIWFIIPSCRDELIRSVKEEVDANKNNMDALRMRDIAMLPSILSGKYGLPNEAQVSTVIEEHCPAVDGELPHAFNHVYEEPESGFEIYGYLKEEPLDFEDEKTSPVQQYMLKQDCDPYVHQTALESDISVLRY